MKNLIQKPMFWRRFFWVLLSLYGVVILLTFRDYGITTDEPLHVTYGENIARWYMSGFSDHTVFTASNLWLYGGLFDTVIHLLRQVVPLDVYDLRHLVCALVGLLGALGAYKVGTALGGPGAGFLAALFLVLTPRFYGHAFNNTKDIPFAVAYLWSLYGLIRCIGALPNLPRRLIWQTGLAIGCALGVRASAALLVMYLGLFFALRHIQLMWDDREVPAQNCIRTLIQTIGIGAVAYVVLFPVYPWLHVHPITGVWDSVTAFASFPEVHYNFFEGQYIASNALPRYYAAKWFLLTLPEFVFLGLIAGVFYVVWKGSFDWLHDPKTLQIGLLVFAVLFPLIYGAIARTPLLNGIRHMTFVIPPLAILSAMGIVSVTTWLSRRWAYGFAAGVGCFLLLALSDLIALHPNQVVHFNRLFAGGIQTASEKYELDYWNNASRQGINWIERQHADTEQSILIGSFYKNIPLMMHGARFDFTLKPYDADYYLGNVWFEHHRAVPGEVVHTVSVKDVPLLYVIRPDSSYQSEPFFDVSPLMYDRLGDHYRTRGDLEMALEAYKRALDRLQGGFKATWLDSSGILHKMGNVALKMDRPELAQFLFGRIPNQTQYAGSIANNWGLYFIGKKAYRVALDWLQKAVEIAPEFYIARISLANLHLTLRDTIRAVKEYRAAGEGHTVQIDRQFEVGKLLYNVGAYEDALVCFCRMIDLHEEDARGHFFLGLTYSAMETYNDARLHFERVVEIDPEYADVFRNLGMVCMYLSDYEAAVKAFQSAIEIKPNQSDLYTLMGVSYGNLKQFEKALKAFDQALAWNPGDATARHHQRFLQSMVKK